MRNLIILLLSLCLSVVIKGQDKQVVVEDFHQEKIDFFADWWQNPAMRFHFPIQKFTDVSLNFSEQDHTAFATQEGSGSNGFLFRANSFFRDTLQSYYGKAWYRKENKEGCRWNTVVDVNRLQPYIIADTLTNKVYAEHYFFSGGYARRFSQIALGAFASYRATTAYKKRDPRPNSTVSDLKVKLGATWRMSAKYSLGFHLDMNKYKQDQSMSIYKEGGSAPLYYLRGLGVADERFSTVITDRSGVANKYKQYIYGVNLTLFPSKQFGFLGTFSSDRGQLNLLKHQGAILLDISSLYSQQFKSSVGYKFRFRNVGYLVKAYGQFQALKGKEYIYRQNMTLLSIAEKYKKTVYTTGGEVLVSYKKGKRNSLTKLNVFYLNTEEQYAGLRATTSNAKKLQSITADLQENLFWKFEKSSLLMKLCLSYRHNLSKDLKTGSLTAERAKETLVLPDYFFETADYLSGQFSIRYDYKLATKYSVYGKVTSGYAKYKNIGNRKFYKLAIGLAF